MCEGELWPYADTTRQRNNRAGAAQRGEMANGVNSNTVTDRDNDDDGGGEFRSVIVPHRLGRLVKGGGEKERNGCKLIPFDTALKLNPPQLATIDDDQDDIRLSELRVETV